MTNTQTQSDREPPKVPPRVALDMADNVPDLAARLAALKAYEAKQLRKYLTGKVTQR